MFLNSPQIKPVGWVEECPPTNNPQILKHHSHHQNVGRSMNQGVSELDFVQALGLYQHITIIFYTIWINHHG
jgi:hypothetical protein